MRPRLEARLALAAAVQRLVLVQGPVSWREAAVSAKVGYDVARRTVVNMVRAGELVIAGQHKPPGQRWHALYEPKTPSAGVEAPTTVVRECSQEVMA